jgi:hypothetical protein
VAATATRIPDEFAASYDQAFLQLTVSDGTGGYEDAPFAPNGAFLIGSAASGLATFSGNIDELRVSTTAFPPLRLQAEHVNQRAANANPFVVFSAPEIEP